MSKQYYKKASQLADKNYVAGRNFEYLAMRYLRKHGWHTMRRFGSIGVIFCARCGREVSRKTKRCPTCETSRNVVKASLDFTAYKNGLYLMVTAKYSAKKATVYLDDPYWKNLVTYARFYNAIPLFVGVTEDHKIYFVDLRTLATWDAFYRFKVNHKPDPKHMERLIQEAWKTIDECNKYLEETENAENPCKVCAKRARWAAIKSQTLNILNRILWRAGISASPDDLTQLLSEPIEEGGEMESDAESI